MNRSHLFTQRAANGKSPSITASFHQYRPNNPPTTVLVHTAAFLKRQNFVASRNIRDTLSIRAETKIEMLRYRPSVITLSVQDVRDLHESFAMRKRQQPSQTISCQPSSALVRLPDVRDTSVKHDPRSTHPSATFGVGHQPMQASIEYPGLDRGRCEPLLSTPCEEEEQRARLQHAEEVVPRQSLANDESAQHWNLHKRLSGRRKASMHKAHKSDPFPINIPNRIAPTSTPQTVLASRRETSSGHRPQASLDAYWNSKRERSIEGISRLFSSVSCMAPEQASPQTPALSNVPTLSREHPATEPAVPAIIRDRIFEPSVTATECELTTGAGEAYKFTPISPPKLSPSGLPVPDLPSHQELEVSTASQHLSLSWSNKSCASYKQNSPVKSFSAALDTSCFPSPINAKRVAPEDSAPFLHVSPLEDLRDRLRDLMVRSGSEQNISPCYGTASPSDVSSRLLTGALFYESSSAIQSPIDKDSYRDVQRPHLLKTPQTTVRRVYHAGPPCPRTEPAAARMESGRYVSRSFSLSPHSVRSSESPPSSMTRMTTRKQPPQSVRRYMLASDSILPDSTPQTAPTRTPRIPIYDDRRPAALQPQTPADLRSRRMHPSIESGSPASLTQRSSVRTMPASRARYRSVRRANERDGESLMMSPPGFGHTQPWVRHGTHRARPVRQPVQQENEFDPVASGLDAEVRAREAYTRTGVGQAHMDSTPPHQGRFESYLR